MICFKLVSGVQEEAGEGHHDDACFGPHRVVHVIYYSTAGLAKPQVSIAWVRMAGHRLNLMKLEQYGHLLDARGHHW